MPNVASISPRGQVVKAPLVSLFMPRLRWPALIVVLTADRRDVLTIFNTKQEVPVPLCQDVSGAVRDFPKVLMSAYRVQSKEGTQ